MLRRYICNLYGSGPCRCSPWRMTWRPATWSRWTPSPGTSEVGQDQQIQICRWPEVLLLVGECSEEPVVTLSAKKTELLSSAAKCVQRQCTCTCCYVASCTEDLRTTEHYGSYVLIFQDKTCSSYSLETVRRCPREVATVTRTLKLTQELKWGGGDREEQDQRHREEALPNFRTSWASRKTRKEDELNLWILINEEQRFL